MSGSSQGHDWHIRLRREGPELRDFDPMRLLDSIVGRAPDLSAQASDLYVVIAELCANALEHGVLGLDSALKENVDGFGDYYLERESRLSSLINGWVQVDVYGGSADGTDRLTIQVEDSGQGFQPHHTTPRSARALPHGRGMSLVRSLCQSVDYSSGGCRVTVVFPRGVVPQPVPGADGGAEAPGKRGGDE